MAPLNSEKKRALAKALIEWKSDEANANVRAITKANKVGKSTLYKYAKVWSLSCCCQLPYIRQIEEIVAFLDVIIPPAGRYYLTPVQEQHLVNWAIIRSNRGRPPTAGEVMYMARGFKIIGMREALGERATEEDFDKLTSYLNSDDVGVELPTHNWFYAFAERHGTRFKYKTLNTKTAARYDSEDPITIKKWFDEVYKPALIKYNITSADQIMAMDEVGFIDNSELHGSAKYLCAIEDDKRIEVRQPNYHYSVLHICTAAGLSMPPITVFQGERCRTEMLQGAPSGTKYQFQSNGYFINEFMPDVIRHIAEHARPIEEQKTEIVTDDRVWRDPRGNRHSETKEFVVFDRLLICDNSTVHMNEEAFILAEQLKIHIIFLPPNSTHIMQVSDLSVFALLKRKWYQTLTNWMIDASLHVEQLGLTRENFWLRLGPAWQAATDIERVRLGFILAGQWPVNCQAVLNSIPSIQNNTKQVIVPASMSLELQAQTQWDDYRAVKRTLSRTSAELKSSSEQLKHTESALEAAHKRIAELEKSLVPITSQSINTPPPQNTTIASSSSTSASHTISMTANFSLSSSSTISATHLSLALADHISIPSSFHSMISFAEKTHTPRRPKHSTKPDTPRTYDSYLYPQHMSDPDRLLDEKLAYDEKARQAQIRMGSEPMTLTTLRGDPNSINYQRAESIIDRWSNLRAQASESKSRKARHKALAAKEKRKANKTTKSKPAKSDSKAQRKKQPVETSSDSSDDELLINATKHTPKRSRSKSSARTSVALSSDSDSSDTDQKAISTKRKRTKASQPQQSTAKRVKLSTAADDVNVDVQASHVTAFDVEMRLTITPQSQRRDRQLQRTFRRRGPYQLLTFSDERLVLRRLDEPTLAAYNLMSRFNASFRNTDHSPFPSSSMSG
jgi:hypothetical protein